MTVNPLTPPILSGQNIESLARSFEAGGQIGLHPDGCVLSASFGAEAADGGHSGVDAAADSCQMLRNMRNCGVI